MFVNDDREDVVIDLKARLNRARGLIAKLEWGGELRIFDCCVECGENEIHSEDCEVHLVLEAEGLITLRKRNPVARARYWEQQWSDARAEIAELRMELAKHG